MIAECSHTLHVKLYGIKYLLNIYRSRVNVIGNHRLIYLLNSIDNLS